MRNPLVAAIMGLAAMSMQPITNAVYQWRQGTPARRRKSKNKDDLPKGYAGAKLARKALSGSVGVRNVCALGVVHDAKAIPSGR